MMNTTVRPPIASTRHTLILIGIFCALAILGGAARQGGHIQATSAPHGTVLPLYVSVLAGEWALVGYVARGLRGRRVVSIADLIAGQWGRPIDVIIDVAIAAVVWFLWLAIQVVAPGTGGAGALLPRGPAEVAVWMALAVSAGICEEIVFRGYLQTQLTVLTRSDVAGIILQAAVFGVGHLYEGIGSVARIALYGGLFGVVARWRRSLRPGIIAHAWSDLFPMFVS